MTARRYAALAAFLAALCISVYWYALRSWFVLDDFAWLGLPLEIHTSTDFWKALFEPRAQGTVRVLSERAFFLVLTSIFGYDAVPFRIVVFATQIANLLLVVSIGRRLTRSWLAGVSAAIFWTFCPALATPMAWASGYNQILWAFFLLAAFQLLLLYIDTGQRRYWYAQWAAYLLGFATLELNVVYPVLALLFALLFARNLVRKVLWLFVPAVAFAAVHFAVIRKPDDPIYRMYFDGDLPRTLYKFLAWSIGPSRLGYFLGPGLRKPGYFIAALTGLGLGIFIARRLLRRDRVVVFLLAWFVIIIAPLVPLKNHVVDYYPAVPAIGLALLGGFAFARAWHSGPALRTVAVALTFAYCACNYLEIRNQTQWYAENSLRLKQLLELASQTRARNPNRAILLDGVDWDLYAAGFNDQPFRLYGIQSVYILPSNMRTLEADATALRGLEGYHISARNAEDMLARGDAVALFVSGRRILDETERYRAVLAFNPAAGERSEVNAGDAAQAGNLSGTWYAPESGFRWMGRSAAVRLAGPEPGQKLRLSGFAPVAVLARGPLHLTVACRGHRIGELTISHPDQPFEAEFPLSASLVGAPAITIELWLDRTTAPPGDSRELGVIFGRFEVR